MVRSAPTNGFKYKTIVLEISILGRHLVKGPSHMLETFIDQSTGIIERNGKCDTAQ